MTAPSGGISLQLLLDTARAQAQLRRDMERAGQQAGRQASNSFDSAFRPRNIADALLPAAGAALVVGGFQRIIKAATSYNQALNATEQIYGDVSDSVNRFVQANARGLGLAKGQAQDYINQFGSIFIGLGKGTEEAAEFSKRLTEAGGALAAFRNTSVEQAVLALQAGFRGEYDSLQRFIPQVSDLTLTNKALALGLAETRSQVDQQDKAMALLDIVQNSVARSAGKAELEQGNLQTRLAETKAQATDTAAALGRQMVPALEGTLDVINAVGPAFVAAGIGAVLLGRRMQASAAAGTGFIATTRASISSTIAYSAALQRQQAVFASMTVTQAIANRSAILANAQILASSRAVQAGLTGTGATFGRYIGAIGAAATTTTGFARVTGVAAASMGAMRAGAGALIGALGGPFTLAIVAATVGIGILAQRHSRAKEEAKRQRQEVEDLAKEIAGLTDQTGAAQRATAAKFLADKGVLKQAQELGLSVETVTAAYAGEEGALKSLQNSITIRRKSLQALMELQRADGRSTQETARALGELYELEKSLGVYTGDLKDATDAQNLYNRAMGQSANQMAGISDVWLKAKEALDDYREAEEFLVSGRVALLDSQIAVEEAFDALTESIKENGRSLDITNAKGRENIERVKEYVQSLYDQAESEVALTGTVSAETQKRINSLKAQLTQMGFNEKEIENIIAAYRRVPPEVVTQIKVLGGADAKNELTAIGKKAVEMIAQYNLTPTQAFGLASGRDPRAVFGQNRAYGGPVLGPSRGDRTDDQIVRATPGEWVIQKPSVRRLEQQYGSNVMSIINDGTLPMYAEGGRVEHAARPKTWQSWQMLLSKAAQLHAEKKKALTPDNTIGGPGGGALGGSRGMMALLRTAFPGLPLISGYRPGDRTLSGNISYHSSDRAVDVRPQREIAAWINANYGTGTRELISPWNDLNLHNGRRHTYTGAVWNQHNFAGGNAHVHWAYDQGGMMNPGDVGVNYGRHPEAVLDQEETARFKGLVGGGVALRLDEYTITRIAQAISIRPAQIVVDGRVLAETAFNHADLR